MPKKYRVIYVAVFVMICLVGKINCAEEKLFLHAKAAVLMDADSYRVLYGVNEDVPLPMASTTKIMTLLITLEHANLDEIVVVSDYAASMPDVQLNIKKNEQYYLRDLVYSMMLESHNDSAVAIAEHVGGSVEQFSNMMNEKAKEIGCKDTFYITPNGLDAEIVLDTGKKRNHVTTAKELAKIMSYCVTKADVKDEFCKITQTDTYTFSDLSGKRHFSLRNHNSLLQMMDGAISGKTGYTGKAGYCYVGTVKKEDKTFTVALLACGWPNHKNYKWQDTDKLITYGRNNFERFDLTSVEIPEEYLYPVNVVNSDGSMRKAKVGIDMSENTNNVFLKRKDEKVYVEVEKIMQLSAPAKKNQFAGTIRFYCGADCMKTLSLYLVETVNSISYWDIWIKVAEYMLL